VKDLFLSRRRQESQDSSPELILSLAEGAQNDTSDFSASRKNALKVVDAIKEIHSLSPLPSPVEGEGFLE
jgi:hypothetical protein